LENFRLKVFRAVADQLSFRRAAEQLFLTQPAVTLQVKTLEDELGVRLFDRAAGRISLTRQGALLLGYAQEISNIIDKAEQELAAAEGQVSGKLDLGVSTTIAQYVLPRLIAAFLTENPRVSLSLHSGNTDEVVQFVLQEKASAGLIEGPPRKRGVRAEPFMRDELVLIVPRDFESDDVSRDQLLASTLLMREQGSGSHSVVETALVKAGVKLKTLRNVMNLGSTEAIKSAVEAGLGIGFVSRWAISKELELGLLRVANVTGIRIVRPFSLTSRTGPEPQGPAGVFRAFVLGRARLLSTTPKHSRHSANSSR
jgi:DNA-binding transcriptional LysR family regulator